MENPNEYNDEKFLETEEQLAGAVRAMWDAGATEQNIRDSIEDLLEGRRDGAPWNE